MPLAVDYLAGCNWVSSLIGPPEMVTLFLVPVPSAQRKDYTALTKFLPPKHEYVLAVRVTPIQCKLYRYYLENFTGEQCVCVCVCVCVGGCV